MLPPRERSQCDREVRKEEHMCKRLLGGFPMEQEAQHHFSAGTPTSWCFLNSWGGNLTSIKLE